MKRAPEGIPIGKSNHFDLKDEAYRAYSGIPLPYRYWYEVVEHPNEFGATLVLKKPVEDSAESDPTCRNPGDPGAKLDEGKPEMSLVFHGFARALTEVGEVATYGATKYSRNGWCEAPDGVRRYTDAMCRHFLKEGTGERLDPDSGLFHAAQVAWNALARLDLMIRERENGGS